MERLELTQAQQDYVNDYRSTYTVDPQAELTEGTNLIVDDHLQVDNNWYAIILGPSPDSPGCLDCYIPAWGEFWLPLWQVEVYVTDRAGPNGEVMPVFEVEQPLVAQAAAASASAAAHRPPPKPPRRPRRSLEHVLIEAVQRKVHADQRRILDSLRKQGAIGHGH